MTLTALAVTTLFAVTTLESNLKCNVFILKHL